MKGEARREKGMLKEMKRAVRLLLLLAFTLMTVILFRKVTAELGEWTEER